MSTPLGLDGVPDPLLPARMVCFTVAGDPLPQGSLSAKPIYAGPKCPACQRRRLLRVGMAQAKTPAGEKAFAAWRARVTAAARLAMGGDPPLTGPVAIRCTITVGRPAGHYSTGQTTAGRLLPSAPAYPAVRPDGPKYQRAVEDSLTDAGLWKDDAQVVDWHGAERYPIEPPARPRPLSLGDDPVALCGVPWADVLPHPGVVIRVWQLT